MTFIIAECGVCHNGRWETGLDLIDAAHQAGADCVKFQHFNSQRLWGDDRIKHLELSNDAMIAMKAHCDEAGIEFLCTPFGVEEVEVLNPLVKRWKIASGCLQKRQLLEAVAKTGKQVILSTGMSSHQEVLDAWAIFEDAITLHCTSAYPCPVSEVNLRAMDVLPKPHGYSDHTPGITIALAAVSRGAVVLEKHLTLDRNQEGPDHKSSIEPKEFRIMVDAIRIIEKALGDGVKKIQPSERALRKAWYGN
jgi:N,N'-diacetyllegionaminate synthase